jgi:hypothetical protein
MLLIVLRSFYAVRHRFHRVDTSCTAANATTQMGLLLLHVDHLQKWDFWTHHCGSAENELNRANQLYIRLTGSREVSYQYTSEAQSPTPGTSQGIGKILGLGFGSFVLCLVVCLFFLLRVAASLYVFFLAL